MVVDDADVVPLEIHAEMLHISVNSSIELVAFGIFDPFGGAGRHVGDGGDEE